MPIDSWPPKRFSQAAKHYREDCEKIRNALNAGTVIPPSDANLRLRSEEQLGLGVECAIRYHLRRLFNPLYFQPTTCEDLDDAGLERCNTNISRVSELLVFELPPWYLGMMKGPGKESAVLDGSISCVFSLAVQSIVNYVGAASFFAGDFIVETPDVFCSSQASKRGLGSRKRPIPRISEEDLRAVTDDIDVAQTFLAAAKACRFLITLLEWPGVMDEIRILGGWEIIEEHAQTMSRLHLDRFVPESAHFVVLRSVDAFLSRIRSLWNDMQPKVATCTDALDTLYRQFECETKNKRRLRKYPEIHTIRGLLLDGLRRHMFPAITEPSLEIESASSDDIDGPPSVDEMSESTATSEDTSESYSE
uniref:Uncharacterized protein n=1 Tax=Grammatophora oceanica TaxID=210454 RepID=A0A7S1YG87_9STRA